MKFHVRHGSVAALAAACLLASACSGGQSADARGGERAGGGAFVVDAKGCPPDATEALPDGAPIKIGMSMALSGPLAAIGAPNADGFKAALAAANAGGGVDGHKIELVLKDDAYDAARATANAQEFIGKDKVMASILAISDASISATRPLYEQACVPQLGSISAHEDSSDPVKHAWTTVAIPPAAAEAAAGVKYLAKTVPHGKVMEFRQQATIGEDWAASFPRAAKAAGLSLLDVQTISPTATNLDAQAAKLTASGADAVVGELAGAQCIPMMQSLAKAGFKGVVLVTSACNGAKQNMMPIGKAADGVASLFFQKDPSVASAKDDPGLKQYFSDLATYMPHTDPTVTMTLNGYTAAELLIQNLRDAAKMDGGLTRVNLIDAAWSAKIRRTEFLEPDQSMNGDKDPYIINYVAVQTWDAVGQTWKPTGISNTWDGRH
ncbi:ABC transporter substrate-binding protein [Nocardioides cheoyonin]|uniref:ABC transporter substrate-binding protein n=1 Tax=Nocardioides cheoyonin TaxID=3156615 RepID=UPI0032B576B8